MPFVESLITFVTGNHELIAQWGYVGIFLSSLIGTATILQMPNFLFIFTFGAILNPILVALASSTGGTIGGITSYLVGLGGKEMLEKKYGEKLKSMRKSFAKHGAFLWIIVLGVTPIPDNIISGFCGIIKYDFKKYLLASFIGKLMFALILSLGGYYSINWILDMFNLPRIG